MQQPHSRRVGRPHRFALVTVLLLVLSACSATNDTPSGESVSAGALFQAEDDDRTLEEKVDTDGDGEMSDEEIETYARATLLDFSQCMRDNGFPDFTDVVLEDFTEGSGGQGAFIGLMVERGVSLGDPDAIATLQSCGTELQNLQTFAPQPSDAEVEEREEQLLEFASCMREQGLDNWPDPDFAANPNGGYGAELLQEFDIESDEVQEAGGACQADGRGFNLEDETEEDDEAEDEDTPDDEVAASDEGADEDEVAEETAETPEDGDRTAISPLIEGDTSDLNVVEVTRGDLVTTKSLSGTLGFGETRPFPTNTTGIVTALPVEGDIIDFGDTLFEVDNVPVLLLEGSLPQYRRFDINMDDGADIEQLEQNLVDLGYAEDIDLTIDDDFTGFTRDAIEAMQEELGVDDSGRIELGRVVFANGPVRIGTINVELGQTISPQVTVLNVTENDQRITINLDAEDRALFEVGTEVDVELPDNSVVPGLVDDVADVANQALNPATGALGDPTIEVTVVFDGPTPDSVFDAAPVDIVVAEDVVSGVLTVPVPALIALSGGGHAVELVVEGGTQLIEVELGSFVDDLVEVSGDIREGDQVVMATAG